MSLLCSAVAGLRWVMESRLKPPHQGAENIKVAAEVRALEQKCRDALLLPSVFNYLIEKERAHGQICALLDFIGDSEIALATVSAPKQRAKIEPYFLAYGLLQVMHARQAALRAVFKTLGVAIPESLEENSIDTSRHRTIGHPITSDGGAHVILRNTLDTEDFEFASYRPTETERGNVVTYETLLLEHWTVMKEGLTLLYLEIAEIENRRRREMCKTPLAPTLQGIDHVVRCLAAATAERYGEEDAAYHVDRVIEGATMLQELHPFTDNKARQRFEIVADGVECDTKKLIRMAQEIDETESIELKYPSGT